MTTTSNETNINVSLMAFWLFICTWIFLIAVIFLVLVWVHVSTSHFTRHLLKPNQEYTVSGRSYRFPNLYCEGPIYLQTDDHINESRTLTVHTMMYLTSLGVPCFVTGGTLLGVIRHNSIPMPFDDDVDMAVDDEHRDLLFSETFSRGAKNFGLQTVYLVGASSTSAERVGACVRMQLIHSHATLDIFFWKKIENNKTVVKLDGWTSRNNVIMNQKEQFHYSDVYPLQDPQTIDGLPNVQLPHRPINLLYKQYGNSVLEKVYARSIFASHAFPFRVLTRMWTHVAPG